MDAYAEIECGRLQCLRHQQGKQSSDSYGNLFTRQVYRHFGGFGRSKQPYQSIIGTESSTCCTHEGTSGNPIRGVASTGTHSPVTIDDNKGRYRSRRETKGPNQVFAAATLQALVRDKRD
ncbi:hypothetical protein ElyMa_005000300 [Elysia marginata]|uniref:Uncharacterized protein n=1 Tax=Elysia marginata TaxID=1093978 RepID=A0AAV4J908_9GAST|nr:hypothetical protein ElyMa_005000300 [Elysia marginata]